MTLNQHAINKNILLDCPLSNAILAIFPITISNPGSSDVDTNKRQEKLALGTTNVLSHVFQP